MPGTRLGRDDWVRAALDVLLRDGPDAVAVQPVARSLGATKGSFYWHFDSRDDLLRAVLLRWEQVGTGDVIAEVEAGGGTPRDRAGALLVCLTASNGGQLRLLAATAHPDVAAAVERASEARIGYLTRLLRSAGLSQAAARRRAVLGYATYLGHAHLAQAAPAVLPSSPRAQRAFLDEIVALLFA